MGTREKKVENLGKKGKKDIDRGEEFGYNKVNIREAEKKEGIWEKKGKSY